MERFKGACTDWTSYAEINRPNYLISGRFAEKQGTNRFGRLILANRKQSGYAVIRISSILNGRTNSSGGSRPPPTNELIERKLKGSRKLAPSVFAQTVRTCSHWTATDGMDTTRPGDAKDFCCMRIRAETFSP
jgi:hypothetical protein